MKTILVQCSFLVMLIAFGCKEKTAPKEATVVTEKSGAKEQREGKKISLTREQYDNIGVELGKFEKRNLKSIVKANGYLKLPPQKIGDISTFMGGIVKKVHVIEGSYVKEGEVLATLQHPDFIKLQEEYLKAKASLVFLEQEFQRQKQLYSENIGAAKTFQLAEANYRAEKDRFSSLKEQLILLHVSLKTLDEGKIESLIPVVTPISGYVSKVNVNTGSFAEPIKLLFEVVDNSHIHVDLMVYEKDWYKVKVGQKIHFEMPNQNNKKVEGEVFAVGKSFDDRSKSLAVHAEIMNNNKYGLVPGIYVNGIIDVGANNVNTLPTEAVVKSGGTEYIFLFNGKEKEGAEEMYVFEIREVKTGNSELGFIEAQPIEGLDFENTSIVTKGAYYLLSQLKNEEGGGE